MNRENYIEYAKNNFSSTALDLVLKNIELYYKENIVVKKNKYQKGEEVFLKKGTFLHGLGGSPDSYDNFKVFDYVCENGFIGGDFNGRPTVKILNSVGMWNIKKDQYLKDYINFYSGTTIKYRVGNREIGLTDYYDVAPFGKAEDYFIKYNNQLDVWQWSAEQTKEIRFMPSLSSEKNQIAFIINMESDYAKEVVYQDVWNPELRKQEILKYFCSEYFLPEMLKGDFNPMSTDRESAIMFGLSQKLIEGVLVGRKLENDINSLNYIKSKLPECYICNLDGKVIIENS